MYETIYPSDPLVLVDQPFRRGDLYRVRATVAAQANRRRLPPAQIDKLVLVVSELVVNAVSHGGGRGRLRLWCTQEGIWCEVSDEGPGMRDLNAGKEEPTPGVAGGRGLWAVRTVCSAVDIQSRPGGTTVKAFLTYE